MVPDESFALKACEPIGILREGFRQHLQRHVAVELRVTRAIDFAHAASTNLLNDLVWSERGTGFEAHESVARFADLGGDGIRAELTDAEADQYSAALDALWTALRGRETLSRRYVERALQVAILEACDPKQQDPGTLFQDRLVKAVAKLRRELTKTPIKWEVHLPVKGLDKTGLPMRIGGVKFRVATTAILRSWRSQAYGIIEKTADPPEKRAEAKKSTRRTLRRDFGGGIFASVTVEALDTEAAQALAHRVLQSVLDVVNFFADLLHPAGSKPHVYLSGARESVSVTSLVFQENQLLSVARRRTGPLIGFNKAPRFS